MEVEEDEVEEEVEEFEDVEYDEDIENLRKCVVDWYFVVLYGLFVKWQRLSNGYDNGVDFVIIFMEIDYYYYYYYNGVENNYVYLLFLEGEQVVLLIFYIEGFLWGIQVDDIWDFI